MSSFAPTLALTLAPNPALRSGRSALHPARHPRKAAFAGRHPAALAALAVLAWALSPAPLWAQAEPAARLQWSNSAAYSHYREPSIGMQLKGPELGVHLRLSDLRGLGRLELEVDLLGGAQNYSSADGQLERRRPFDTRWHAL